jgi:selenophosphate synthetase-related protein
VTSFDAGPGQAILVVTDLRGAFRDPFPWWDASTSATDAQLRAGLEILPELAEQGLLTAAKDISMAGVVGTAIMLAEASSVGMRIDLDSLPMPRGVSIEKWLSAFPSFGFVMTAAPEDTARIIARFNADGVACAEVGRTDAGEAITIEHAGESALVWHRAAPLTGCHRSLHELEETENA